MQKADEKRCFANGNLYNKTLVAGLRSGDFTDYGIVTDMKACVKFCCADQGCDLALMLGLTCYTLHCASLALCQVRPAHPSSLNPRISYVTRIKLPNVASISMIVGTFEGYKESEVIAFKPSPLIAKVKLTVSDEAPIRKILIALVKAVKAGKMVASIDGVVETFELSSSGFLFNTPRGEARRSCHGSETNNASWAFPSFVDCETSTYKTLLSKAKGFAEGAKKKIPFKTLQSKLRTTPSEILIQIQKLTFEDTYRAMIDKSRNSTNTSLGHAKKGPLRDSKHAPQGHPKPAKTPNALYSNDTFSIPLPDHEDKAKQTTNTKTFSRGNIPKSPQRKPAKTSTRRPVSHSSIVQNPKVLQQQKPLPGNTQIKPQTLGTTKNQVHSSLPLTSAFQHQHLEHLAPNNLVSGGSTRSKYGIVPMSASQTSAPASSNVRYSNNQVAQRQPQSTYQRYQQQLRVQKAAQARQRLLQQQRSNAVLNNQASQRSQGWPNSRQPWQQGFQNNRGWQGNQLGSQGGQAGYTSYGGVPGYGLAGFPQDRPANFKQKDVKRKKRDTDKELVRVKRQGGDSVWYGGYKVRRPTPRRNLYSSLPNVNNEYSREPILTNVQMGYDDPGDKRQGLSPYNENRYFHGPTPYYQTATYRLGQVASPTQGVTGASRQSQPFDSYPTNSVTGLGNPARGLASRIPNEKYQTGFTSSTPGRVSQTTGTFGSSPHNIQYLVTTSKPSIYHTTARQTPQQGSSVMTTAAPPLTSTTADKSKDLKIYSLPTVQKATATPTPKATHSVIDLLKKKLQDLTTQSKANKANTESSRHPVEDFSQEKNRAPMFGGDIALIVETLRYLSLYSKYTNPPETVDTLKQFLQVGSHILDNRNKHEWKYLTKRLVNVPARAKA
ncbi:hypothetical protein QZH41_007613 [Actinostola sp. cb2023]|nr:hypothetical protein QZH41_007613 [Actinostola sp. cb2023]